MDVTKWALTVKQAVDRYAKTQYKDVKQDLEQECFVRILESLPAIELLIEEQGETPAKNYVYGICHNCIMETLKPYPRSVSALSSDDPSVKNEIQSKASEAESVWGVTEQDLDEAVKQLPRVEQHVIRSLYFHNMSERGLAKTLNLTQWAIQQIKQDATIQLREILESK